MIFNLVSKPIIFNLFYKLPVLTSVEELFCRKKSRLRSKINGGGEARVINLKTRQEISDKHLDKHSNRSVEINVGDRQLTGDEQL